MSPRALALRGIPAGVEPKADEMVRLRDVIYKLAEQGYKVVPAEDGPWTSFVSYPKAGEPVVASLKTRCGCTREQVVKWSPPKLISIPMLENYQAYYNDGFKPGQSLEEMMRAPSFSTREFEFVQVIERRVDNIGPYGFDGRQLRLVYREVL